MLRAKTFFTPRYQATKNWLNVCVTAYLLLQLYPRLRKQPHSNMLQFLDYIFVRQIHKTTEFEGVESPAELDKININWA